MASSSTPLAFSLVKYNTLWNNSFMYKGLHLVKMRKRKEKKSQTCIHDLPTNVNAWVHSLSDTSCPFRLVYILWIVLFFLTWEDSPPLESNPILRTTVIVVALAWSLVWIWSPEFVDRIHICAVSVNLLAAVSVKVYFEPSKFFHCKVSTTPERTETKCRLRQHKTDC